MDWWHPVSTSIRLCTSKKRSTNSDSQKLFYLILHQRYQRRDDNSHFFGNQRRNLITQRFSSTCDWIGKHAIQKLTCCHGNEGISLLFDSRLDYGQLFPTKTWITKQVLQLNHEEMGGNTLSITWYTSSVDTFVHLTRTRGWLKTTEEWAVTS